MARMTETVRIRFPEGVVGEALLTDGPGDRLLIRAGQLRLELAIEADACADLAAFFGRAAGRRGPVVEPPTRAEKAAAKKARRP